MAPRTIIVDSIMDGQYDLYPVVILETTLPKLELLGNSCINGWEVEPIFLLYMLVNVVVRGFHFLQVVGSKSIKLGEMYGVKYG